MRKLTAVWGVRMIKQQSFYNLKSFGFYVDKTREIYSMVKNHRSVLFVRPRKFGKSLLLATLEELFSGNRELFRDTYIYDETDYDFKEYPVITINLHLDVTKPSEFATSLKRIVKTLAKDRGLKLTADKPDELLREFTYSFKDEVVVLIDNYDFVLADNITNPEIEQLDQMLARFISVLNDPEHFRFVFLTGINNFLLCENEYGRVLEYDDLTLDPEVAEVCGLTADELRLNYINKIVNLSSKTYVKAHGVDEIDAECFSHSKISQIYAEYLKQEEQRTEDLVSIIMRTLGGYRFGPKQTNLASMGFVLEFLRGNGVFELNYDLRCARGYLVKKLQEDIFNIDSYAGVTMDPVIGCGPHYSYRPRLGSLLLHNGILTFASYEDLDGEVSTRLTIPNLEVQNFLAQRLKKKA